MQNDSPYDYASRYVALRTIACVLQSTSYEPFFTDCFDCLEPLLVAGIEYISVV